MSDSITPLATNPRDVTVLPDTGTELGEAFQAQAGSATDVDPAVGQGTGSSKAFRPTVLIIPDLRFPDVDGQQGPASRGFLLNKNLPAAQIDAAITGRYGYTPPVGVTILQDPATANQDHALVMWVISPQPTDVEIDTILTELEPEA